MIRPYDQGHKDEVLSTLRVAVWHPVVWGYDNG